jgi:peroxiredoxin Q/BCP
MIDPSKATKGRRMSKKTRTTSPKKSVAKTTSKTTGKATSTRIATPAKTAAAKTRRAAANPVAKTGKRVAKTTPKASQKAASKSLKSSVSKSASKKTTAKATGGLAEGAKAPAFHLPRDGGATVSLADFSGQKLVLFFYPRADTPGCTREAIDFTRLADAFAEAGTHVVGVSADTPKVQESFRNKHKLSIPLASDEQHQMLEAYGAWGEKSMYGKTFLGIIRTTVLIGPDGRIARTWRHVKVDGHADEVLAAAKAI